MKKWKKGREGGREGGQTHTHTQRKEREEWGGK